MKRNEFVQLLQWQPCSSNQQSETRHTSVGIRGGQIWIAFLLLRSTVLLRTVRFLECEVHARQMAQEVDTGVFAIGRTHTTIISRFYRALAGTSWNSVSGITQCNYIYHGKCFLPVASVLRRQYNTSKEIFVHSDFYPTSDDESFTDVRSIVRLSFNRVYRSSGSQLNPAAHVKLPGHRFLYYIVIILLTNNI